MKRGHLRKMQNALFEIDRLLTYHEKFYNTKVKPVKEEMDKAKDEENEQKNVACTVDDRESHSDESNVTPRETFSMETPEGSILEEDDDGTASTLPSQLGAASADRLHARKKMLLPI